MLEAKAVDILQSTIPIDANDILNERQKKQYSNENYWNQLRAEKEDNRADFKKREKENNRSDKMY